MTHRQDDGQRRSRAAGLALAGLLLTSPGLTMAASAQAPIGPLPVPTGDQPKLTCADFRKSIVDGTWSSTRSIQTPMLNLNSGATIRRGKTGDLDLVGMLEKDCAARRPS